MFPVRTGVLQPDIIHGHNGLQPAGLGVHMHAPTVGRTLDVSEH